jgi:hypothetical protein
VNPSAKPAAIDFEHTERVFKGKTWEGIYVLEGDTLRTCDNAPDLAKDRPAAFETKSKSGSASSRSRVRILERTRAKL